MYVPSYYALKSRFKYQISLHNLIKLFEARISPKKRKGQQPLFLIALGPESEKYHNNQV